VLVGAGLWHGCRELEEQAAALEGATKRAAWGEVLNPLPLPLPWAHAPSRSSPVLSITRGILAS